MKYLFSLLFFFAVVAAAKPEYPDPTRFVQYDVPNTNAYIIVDTKTGCEYIKGSGTNSSYTLVQGTCKIPEKK